VTEFRTRRERLWESLTQVDANHRPHAYLVSGLANIRYLTGFTGSNALLLVHAGGALLLTDPRYTTQSAQETDCSRSIVRAKSLFQAAPGKIKPRGWKRIGFDPSHVACASLEVLRDALPGVRFVPLESQVERLRMVKSASEIEAIRRAVRINSEAFDRAMEHLRPGISENCFAAEIDYQMRLLGAERQAFETIVASGPRSALVHARPSGDPILANELLLIDMGAHCGGYASDMTRMAFPGQPDRKTKQHHAFVLEAQLAALDAVKPGASSVAVDRAARQVLKRHGVGDAFVHSTGHGLGLEVHEPPRVAKKYRTRLEAGMVITVEPGIYLPDFGGIRIEDTVVVTPHGCEVLTPTPKDLHVV